MESLEPRNAETWRKDVLQDQSLLRKLIDDVKTLFPRRFSESCSQEQFNSAIRPERGQKTRYADWKRRRIPFLLEREVGDLLAYILDVFPEKAGLGSDRANPDLLVEAALRINTYLCVSPKTLRPLRNRLEGYYWVFRPSLISPGRYVRGLVAMWWIVDRVRVSSADGENGMLRVLELHRNKGGSGKQDTPELMEVFDGFAIAKQGAVFLFLSENYKGDRGPLLIARYNNFVPSDPQQPLQIATGRVQGPNDAGHAPPTILVRIATTARPTDLQDILNEKMGLDKAVELKRSLETVKKLIDECQIQDRDGIPQLVAERIESMNRDSLAWAQQQITMGSP